MGTKGETKGKTKGKRKGRGGGGDEEEGQKYPKKCVKVPTGMAKGKRRAWRREKEERVATEKREFTALGELLAQRARECDGQGDERDAVRFARVAVRRRRQQVAVAAGDDGVHVATADGGGRRDPPLPAVAPPPRQRVADVRDGDAVGVGLR